MTVEQWLEDNKLGQDIWKSKYQHNDESFEEWLDRLTRGLDDDTAKNLRQMIIDKKFLYGGRILANLNTDTKQGISNCLTFGYVGDSLEEIMDVAKGLALSFQREAGVGINISKIRPKGAKVGEKGTSDGIIGFLRIFNEVAHNISRGNTRRGALAVTLSAEHPDVMDYIKIKKNNTFDKGEILNANISVAVSDEFMRHYEEGTTYSKPFVVEATGEVIPHIVNPKEIMDAIVDEPSKAFEPGLLFIDRYQENHLFGLAESNKEMASNACFEFYGADGTVCLLGSLNLAKYITNPFTDYARFDVVTFAKDVRTAIFALDYAHDYGIGRNALDLQNAMSSKYRGLGLGIMGLADMFIRKGIRYGSEKSLKLSKIIAETMRNASIKASQELGRIKGQPQGIMDHEFEYRQMEKPYIKGLRNNSLLSIAPAGTIGTMLGISTGIEPVFRTEYVRSTFNMNGDERIDYTVTHKEVERCYHHGGNQDACMDVREVTPAQKAEMLGAWQEFCDLAISNTTNFDKSATVEDIKDFYVKSWKAGVIGGTIYVDGSLDGVLNEVEKKEEPGDDKPKFILGKTCPECFTPLVEQGGCKVCPNCAYSPCN